MSDLYPGMKIEISTKLVEAGSLPPADRPRPEWLSPFAMWPPEPGKVMYMIAESSTGICDTCILTREEEIKDLIYGSRKVTERGDISWYCSMHPNGISCERHWSGTRYDRPR